MKNELWGLKNKKTCELVLYYWASSQKHKALFSSKEKAEEACKWRGEYEPYRIVDHEPEKGCDLCHRFEEDRQWLVHRGNGMYDEYFYEYCPMCGKKLEDKPCGE